MGVLLSKEIKNSRQKHSDKLPEFLKEMTKIHPEKLPNEVLKCFSRTFSKSKKTDYLNVDARFANFYMTLLATNLSDKSGVALLTSESSNNRLSTAARLDAQFSIRRERPRYYNYRYGRHINMPRSLAQGMLADLIIEKITIDPETSVSAILRFKRNHSDELGRFRVKIDELTKNIGDDQPINILRQKVKDIYLNEVSPAINALKGTLTDIGIKWAADNFLKISFFSTGSTSIPLTLLGIGVPYALLVGAGVSLTSSAILYNREKAEKLRQNPFSYLVAAEKELKSKDDIPIVTPL